MSNLLVNFTGPMYGTSLPMKFKKLETQYQPKL